MSNFEFSFTINQENASFSQENSFSVKDTLTSLKEKLDYKSEGFSESNKETYAYYYLIDLIGRIPSLKFRNEREFYKELDFIVQEFPVVNNGKIYSGDYYQYLISFQNYVRKEFGLLPKNRIFWKRFWLLLIILFLLLSTLTASPFFGSILALIISPIWAQTSEYNKRLDGIVLGLRNFPPSK